LEELGGGGAGGAGGGHARLTSGAIGVSGVDGYHADAAARGAQMLLVNQDGGGDDQVGGERGGSAGWSIGYDESKVDAAALFQSGLGGPEAEAARNEESGDSLGVGVSHGHGSQPV